MHTGKIEATTNTSAILLGVAGLLAILTSVGLVALSFFGWQDVSRFLFPSSAHFVTLLLPLVGGVLVLVRPTHAPASVPGAFLILVGALLFMADSRSLAFLPVFALLGVAVVRMVRAYGRPHLATIEQKAAREVLIVFGAALFAPIVLVLLQFPITLVAFVAAVFALYFLRVLVWAWQVVMRAPEQVEQR